MPIYVYQEMLPNGGVGEVIEIEHGMHEPAATRHPDTGFPLRRLYTPPSLSMKHTPGQSQKLTSDSSLEKAGFTKYVRDKVTGQYHRTVGQQGPSQFKPQ